MMFQNTGSFDVKYTFWIVVGFVVFVLLCLVDVISPRDSTVTTMQVIETRIRLYWDSSEQMPESLSELPKIEGRNNRTVDGWGREITYRVKGTTVTLSSLGEDGQQETAKGDQGIIHSFDVSENRGTKK